MGKLFSEFYFWLDGTSIFSLDGSTYNHEVVRVLYIILGDTIIGHTHQVVMN